MLLTAILNHRKHISMITFQSKTNDNPTQINLQHKEIQDVLVTCINILFTLISE